MLMAKRPVDCCFKKLSFLFQEFIKYIEGKPKQLSRKCGPMFEMLLVYS